MIDLNDENIKSYFTNLIDIEISNINNSLERQKDLSSEVLRCLNNIPNKFSPDIDEKILSNTSNELNSISKLLNKISFNSSCYIELLNELKDIRAFISLEDGKTVNDIFKYNITFADYDKQISTNVEKIENFIIISNAVRSTDVIKSISRETVKPVPEVISIKNIETITQKIKPKKENFSINVKEDIPIIKDPVEAAEIIKSPETSETIETTNVTELKDVTELTDTSIQENSIKDSNTKTSNLVENTLIISEIDRIVTLPYTIKELKDIANNNPKKYKMLEDVVSDCYTRPIKDYKNSSRARFKEAYNLIRKKEKGTISEGLSLATELFSNYNLHPAIISACKTLDELDIYLSCLDSNELDDFKFFKIEFNVVPTKTRKQKTSSKDLSITKTIEKGKQLQRGKHIFN